MGKNKIGFLVLCFVCWCNGGVGQSVLSENYPVLEKTTLLRERLFSIAESQVGVREKTGKNDGKEVEMYLRAVGMKKGNPYCAAGMAWCHIHAGIPNPESAWSPDWFKTNVVFKKYTPRVNKFKSRKGQVFGLFYTEMNRVAHVGMITGETTGHYKTIEFNTSGMGGDRDGDGVYRMIRRKESIYTVSDFAGHDELKLYFKNRKK